MAKRKKKKGNIKKVALLLIPIVGILGVFGVNAAIDYQLVFNEKAGVAYGEKKAELEADVALGGTGETLDRRVYTGLYDLTLKDSDSSEDVHTLTRQQISDTIGTASSTFLSIQNNSNYPWLVKGVTMQLFADGVGNGTSGTVRFSMGTSSLAYHTGYDDTTDPREIMNFAFATGTPNGAFLASSTYRGSLVTFEADGNDATSTDRLPYVIVQPDEYILGFMSAYDPTKVSVTSTATGDGRGITTESWYMLDILTHATST